jgi:hypothetical protein
MAEAPRFIQHWKAGKGSRTSFIFLFTDGIAIVEASLDREQELVRALREAPNSSPQALMGEGSWWVPFVNMRRILISREQKALTIETNKGRVSASFNTGVDVDYFLQMLEEDVRLVSWDVYDDSLSFWQDWVRLGLMAVACLFLSATAIVGMNVFRQQQGTARLLPGVSHLVQGTGLPAWGAVLIPAVPILLLFLLATVRGLMAPGFTVYEPIKSASLLNMAAAVQPGSD